MRARTGQNIQNAHHVSFTSRKCTHLGSQSAARPILVVPRIFPPFFRFPVDLSGRPPQHRHPYTSCTRCVNVGVRPLRTALGQLRMRPSASTCTPADRRRGSISIAAEGPNVGGATAAERKVHRTVSTQIFNIARPLCTFVSGDVRQGTERVTHEHCPRGEGKRIQIDLCGDNGQNAT